MIESFIGLGSNLNDPTHQISRAIQRVSDIEKLTLMQRSSLYKSAPMGPQDQEQRAHDRAIEEQLATIAIPRRFTSYVREIWSLQKKFTKRTPKRVERLASHRRFRTAYDFLLLRAECGENVGELAAWWTQYENGTAEQREALLQPTRTPASLTYPPLIVYRY